MQQTRQPLYRKVNTTARGVHHHFGGDFQEARQRIGAEQNSPRRQGMR